jgi:hypothetical protein
MPKASPIDPSRQSLSPWTYSICYAHLLRREGVASLTPHLRDKSCGLRLFRRSARWHNNVVKKAPAAPEPAACPHRSSPPFWAMGKRGYKTERNIAFALFSSFKKSRLQIPHYIKEEERSLFHILGANCLWGNFPRGESPSTPICLSLPRSRGNLGGALFPRRELSPRL